MHLQSVVLPALRVFNGGEFSVLVYSFLYRSSGIPDPEFAMLV